MSEPNEEVDKMLLDCRETEDSHAGTAGEAVRRLLLAGHGF